MALWGKLDQADNAPKFDVDAKTGKTGVEQYGNTTVGYVGTFAASNNEVAASGGKLHGPGWYAIKDRGNGRKNYELLACTRITTDGSDDTIVPDYKIVVSTQPASLTVATDASAVFSVVGITQPAGGTIVYEWQANTGSGFTALVANASITGVATSSLTVDPAGDLGAAQLCVVMSVTGGANVTSSVATLGIE